MNELDALADQFSAARSHLRAVAYRMLGSISDADDVVQEAWLRLSRSEVSHITNVPGWLTTVTARHCLDHLRARKTGAARREAEPTAGEPASGADPEAEVALADSVGLALLVVLESLGPAERIAFVLHDLFDLSFDEIAQVLDRTPEAARQLASRARRRVRQPSAESVPPPTDDGRRVQRRLVEAFLTATRKGDVQELLAVLAPDVTFTADEATNRGRALTVRGATKVARIAAKGGAAAAAVILVDGQVGLAVAPMGRLRMVIRFVTSGDRITHVEAIGDSRALERMTFALLDAESERGDA